ncbi:leucine-rich repeat domain-containing protein [Brachyspira murdochii]|uniref:leucine-rich repeat domain-containing protein n=1 Tax=Brachyspira murdochii TaxID=84378 RepID=UPI0012F4F63E|nr:leucine-rich repeat domain-containing protein [Brachyspira murdochii]
MIKNILLILLSVLVFVSCSAEIISPSSNSSINGGGGGIVPTEEELIAKYGIDIGLEDSIISRKIEENLKSYYEEMGSYRVIFTGTPKESYNNNISSLSFLTSEAAKKIQALNVVIDIFNVDFTDGIIKRDMFADGNIPNETVILNFIFPENKITTIETFAFNYLIALKEISIPNSVITIENDAFQYCSKLEKLILGNNVQTIGDSAFVYAESLKELIIPESVTSIGMGAFANSGIIQTASLKTIGHYAFTTSPNLTTVIYYGTSPTTINNNNAFLYCVNLKTLIVPNADNPNDPAWKTFLGANFTTVTKQ